MVVNFSHHFVIQYQWLSTLEREGHLTDLQQYAQLFTKHNINGKRLTELSTDDLKEIGITSVGHLRDITVSHVLNHVSINNVDNIL